MLIHITLSVPGGISSARSNRSALRIATVNALAQLIQQQHETARGRIVNAHDRQVGEISCAAVYLDAEPEVQGRHR